MKDVCTEEGYVFYFISYSEQHDNNKMNKKFTIMSPSPT